MTLQMHTETRRRRVGGGWHCRVLAATSLIVVILAPRLSAAATWSVNVTDDTVDADGCDPSHCSLPEAILAANANSGADTIVFEDPLALGTRFVINVQTELPPITDDDLTIDGMSCTGCGATQANTLPPEEGFNSQLSVGIDGAGLLAVWTGAEGLLNVQADDVHFSGLSIRNSPASGVVWTGDNGLITNCYIGMRTNGVTVAPNVGHGVHLDGGGRVQVEESNLISGNGATESRSTATRPTAPTSRGTSSGWT